MPAAPLPPNEQERLSALVSCAVLDSDPEPAFDAITALAAELLGVPICLISLVDRDRQWFKSAVGLAASETPRDQAFCAYAILSDEPLVIEDARLDARTRDNPLVTGEPGIRFYAGQPLKLESGAVVGTLCAIDLKPRRISAKQRHRLEKLGDQVARLLDLKRERARAQAASEEASALRHALDEHTLFSVADRSGRITDVNSGFCRISGYTREELIGQDHRLLNSGHHPRSFWKDMYRTLRAGEAWRAEVCNRAKDGSLYWVDSTNIPQLDAEGRLNRIISLRFDVTAKREAERLQRILGAAFERSPDAMVVAGLDGRVIIGNPAARALDETFEHLLEPGAPALLFAGERVPGALLDELRRTVRRGDVFERRLEIAAPEGPSRWLHLACSPLKTEGKEIDAMLVIKRDFTAQVKREATAATRSEGADARARITELLIAENSLNERLHESLLVLTGLRGVSPDPGARLFTISPGERRARLAAYAGCRADAVLAGGDLDAADDPAVSGAIEELRVCAFETAGDAPRRGYVVPLLDEGRCEGLVEIDTEGPPDMSEPRLETLLQIGEVLASTLTRERTAALIRQADRQLREAQDRFELALEGSQDAIFDWNVVEDTVYYSPRWSELLGVPREALGSTLSGLLQHVASSDVRRVETELIDFVTAEDLPRFESEFRLVTADGTIVWALFRAAAVRTPAGVAERVSGSVADISKIKSVEEEMRRMLQTDLLTGLSSRNRFMERLEMALERSRHAGSMCAVLFFDFDRFKVVNDSLGHDVGDELLCSIARRLEAHIRETDTAGRLGGDEFVVLLEDLPDAETAREVAEKLLAACAEPHDVNGHRLISTASIGLVTSEHASGGPAEMLRDADAAMYQAKANGRGCTVEFDRAMHEAIVERLAIEEELRGAIERDELTLYYQPIVELETGKAVGAEALIRWEHPVRGMVSPGVFIPIAEESNQIQALGSWVIDAACRQIVDWKTRGAVREGFRVSINVSKAQLLTPGFVKLVISRVEAHGLEPRDLKLEITETTIVDNRAGVTEVLNELRRRGFTIMMDDFGTGHSSLSGLHALPIDELKIDQSFIRHENASREVIAITSSIVTLADHLRLRTVGEGIETIEQIALLQELGCHYGQGYYFARPLPAAQLEAWLLGDESQRRAA